MEEACKSVATAMITNEDAPFDEAVKDKQAAAVKTKSVVVGKSPMGTIGSDGARNRDELYTVLFRNYIEYTGSDVLSARKMKGNAFKIMFGTFCAIIIFAICFLVYLFIEGVGNTTADIVLAATALASLVTSFISLPTIITKHLFPENANNDTVEIMKALIINDCEVRKAQNEIDKLNEELNRLKDK
jgi:multisubunit Na+/H+ antiporter MnhF subunit